MAALVVSAAPFTPVKPTIKIIQGANSVQFECAAESFEVSPEQDESTIETFCGTYTTYKAEVWTITGSVYQSYNATTGLWNALRPFCNVTTTFEFTPDAGNIVSATNPKMSGTSIVKAFPFYMGAPGEPQAFDVIIAVQGTPTFVIV